MTEDISGIFYVINIVGNFGTIFMDQVRSTRSRDSYAVMADILLY